MAVIPLYMYQVVSIRKFRLKNYYRVTHVLSHQTPPNLIRL
jgi:hypothetical protein